MIRHYFRSYTTLFIKIKQNSYLFFYVILLILFWSFFYLSTLSNTPFGGDSSELVSAMVSWGIAHPPGYPLLVFLGNIFSRLLPFLNPYEKLSLLSAIFTFFSSLTLYFIILNLTRNQLISTTTSLFFLTLFPNWLYGIVPEVFSLATFLITAKIYLVLLIFKSKKNKNKLLIALFFLFGLSISHHHIFILFIPSFFYLIKKSFKLPEIYKIKFLLLGALLSGTVFYLYPPIVSYFNTPLDIENAKTFTGLIRLITRSSYGTFKAYVGSEGDFLNRLLDVFSLFIFIIHDLKPLGFVFIILGFISLRFINLIIFNYLIIQILFLLFFFFYSNFKLGNSFGLATYERFIIFIYIPLLIFFGIGLYNFQLFAQKFFFKIKAKKNLFLIFDIILMFIISFLILNNWVTNWSIIRNIKNNQTFKNFAQDLLQTLPKNSLYLPQSDHGYFLSENLQIVYQFRQDVLIIPQIIDREYIQERLRNKNKLLEFSENLTLEKFLMENSKNFLIFSEKPMTFGFWVPYGILWRFYSDINHFLPEKDKILESNIKFWSYHQIPKIDRREKNILFLNQVREHYLNQYWSYINFLSITNNKKFALKEAEKYLSDFYNHIKYLTIYINLKIQLNECDKRLQNVVQRALALNIHDSVDYIPLLQYFKVCEKNKKKYQEILLKYLNLKEKEDLPLKKI